MVGMISGRKYAKTMTPANAMIPSTDRQRKDVLSVDATCSLSSISRCRLTKATVALAKPSSRISRNGMSEPMSAQTP